jgi:hypothetical protein
VRAGWAKARPEAGVRNRERGSGGKEQLGNLLRAGPGFEIKQLPGKSNEQANEAKPTVF